MPENLDSNQNEQEPDTTAEAPGADYENAAVQTRLADLLAEPDYKNLADFLNVLGSGYLFADATGAHSGKKGTRFRTTRTTKGQLVLPLFTSMQALRAAVGRRKGEAKGVLLPATEALRLIESDRFVAVEVNPGPGALVVLRKYVQLVLAGEPISEEVLAAQRER